MLNFSDGISIDTSGNLRILRLKDGYYVVGQGMCIPAFNREEAKQLIKELTEESKC